MLNQQQQRTAKHMQPLTQQIKLAEHVLLAAHAKLGAKALCQVQPCASFRFTSFCWVQSGTT